jgi:hypothetical protein
MFKGPLTNPISVLCARVAEGCARTKQGIAITARDGQGWIHDLRKNPDFKPRLRPIRASKIEPVVHPFMAELAKSFHANMRRLEIEVLGESLGVSARSLTRLRVGFVKQYEHRRMDPLTGELHEPETRHAKAFTFPMRDAEERVIGIRFRNSSGHKWAAIDSLNGLFIPVGLSGRGPLIVVEGPTETAAVLDWGFDCVGRPGNTGGCELLTRYILQRRRRQVVILRNNDPEGSHAQFLTLMGAETLAASLLARSVEVRIIAPPAGTKDARDWKTKHQGTRADVLGMIARTASWRSKQASKVA